MSPAATVTRRWAVVYRSGAQIDVWAVITGVPAELRKGAVVEALESWQRWPALLARVGVGGRVELVAELHAAWRRWGLDDAAGLPGVLASASPIRLTWAQLAPTQRAITITVPSELWGRVRYAAAQSGLSMRAWCEKAVTDALGAGDDA